MNNNDYLGKLLGEQYNMKNYFVDTYTEPQQQVNVIENVNPVMRTSAQDGKSSLRQNDIQNQNVNTQPFEENISAGGEEERVNKDLNTKNDLEKTNSNLEIKSEESQIQTEQNITEENASKQYQAIQVSTNFTKMYPDIYKAIDPIVELSVANMKETEINEDIIESLASRIYNAIEPSTIPTYSSASNTMPVSVRPYNNLLHDLIKILILNKLVPMPPRPPMPQPRPPMNRPNSMRVSNNINYQNVPYPEDMV